MARRISNGVALQWLGLALIVTGIRWMFTPQTHPGSSLLQTAAVYGQILAGVIIVFYGIRLANREQQILGNRYRYAAMAACWVAAGVLIAGAAGHWLITPASHPGAATLRVFLVWVQVAVGVGLMATGGPKHAREPRSVI